MPLTTGAVADNEHSSSDDPAKPPGQASGASKYWRLFLKNIDRALGFE
jgi:hypothetical protein